MEQNLDTSRKNSISKLRKEKTNWKNFSKKNNQYQNFTVNIMARILQILCNNGKIRISNLSLYGNLNYNRCKNYLNFMKILGWVIFEQQGHTIKVGCTTEGIRILHNLELFIKNNGDELHEYLENKSNKIG